MTKKQQVVAKRLFEFASVIGERHLIQVTVSANLDPVILSLEQPPDYRIETDHFRFPKKKADRPNTFRIHYLVSDEWDCFDLPPTTENLHAIQPLGKERWLLV